MKSAQQKFREEILENACYRLDENLEKISKCLAELTEEEVWKRPNAASNSVGNQLLHLCGNITQYAISSLGNTPDLRERDKEFKATEGFTKAELLQKLAGTIGKAKETIRKSDEASLLKSRSVQGFSYSGIGIIIHVVEHLSYHTGQIAFWVKILRDKDLGFYKDIDLNIKNR